MSKIVEKILTITISLFLIVSLGIPTTVIATRVINENLRYAAIKTLIYKIDYGIKQVISGYVDFYFDHVTYPDNLRVWSKGQSVVVEYTVFGNLRTEKKVYPMLIRVENFHNPGVCSLTILKNGLTLIISFRGEENAERNGRIQF